ncbi:hypothetical protein SAMN05444392_108134 [Seinonella peptonophila]|uniref:Uncharacterized protein n=1 Tax=Seinonella peptonophila TaxID=112248 RepID=A0A1M4ZB00_9BACL|nr:hypothetical protein [Seinonella peptonophila]SHF14987.1 hypothetical protein SAMN05444392_108134 [Seinonella peptonophila]
MQNEIFSWAGWNAIAAIGEVLGAIATFLAVWFSLKIAREAKAVAEKSFKPTLQINHDHYVEDNRVFIFNITNFSPFPIQIRNAFCFYTIRSNLLLSEIKMISENTHFPLLKSGHSHKIKLKIFDLIPESIQEKKLAYFPIRISIEVVTESGDFFSQNYFFCMSNPHITKFIQYFKADSESGAIELAKKYNSNFSKDRDTTYSSQSFFQ